MAQSANVAISQPKCHVKFNCLLKVNAEENFCGRRIMHQHGRCVLVSTHKTTQVAVACANE